MELEDSYEGKKGDLRARTKRFAGAVVRFFRGLPRDRVEVVGREI
jgi:hypothetical protein